VIVDASLNAINSPFIVLFSNQSTVTDRQLVRSTGAVEIHEVDGTISAGPASVIPVTVRPQEIQFLCAATPSDG
jgi:hypothetical protein